MNTGALSRRRLAVASSLALFVIAGCQGLPAVARDPVTLHVQLGDLDLATPVGRKTAYERVHKAARTVCSRASDPLDLGRQPHTVACIARTMEKAMASVEQLALQRQAIQFANSDSR
jgi:UrcA family protein